MPKKTAAAATPAPAPAAAALACGNTACGKALAPPLLQCSKCKAEAYCCKACQVGDPGVPAAHSLSTPYASARSPAPAPFPPACTLPPPNCRVKGRRPVRAFVQARKSASAELGHRRPWPDAPPASSSSRWRRPSPPPPSGSCSVLMMGIRSGLIAGQLMTLI